MKKYINIILGLLHRLVYFLGFILGLLYIPVYFLGFILYYVARLLLALAYALMLCKRKALDIITNLFR